MAETLSIGEVSRRSGLPIKTIRFYEQARIIPAPDRTAGGFRMYTLVDVRRLRLIRQAKLLGLPLPEIKTFVEQAFASECRDFADQFLAQIAAQRTEVDRRIAALENLKDALDTMESHVEHSREQLSPGQRVAGCDFCPILDVDLSAPRAVERCEDTAAMLPATGESG